MADAVVPDATKTKLEAIMQTMIALQKGTLRLTSSLCLVFNSHGLHTTFTVGFCWLAPSHDVPVSHVCTRLVLTISSHEEPRWRGTDSRVRGFCLPPGFVFCLCARLHAPLPAPTLLRLSVWVPPGKRPPRR